MKLKLKKPSNSLEKITREVEGEIKIRTCQQTNNLPGDDDGKIC